MIELNSTTNTSRRVFWMRRLLFLVLVLGLFGGAVFLLAREKTPPVLAVYFSPGGRPTEAIVEALNQAKQAVLVQAYSFTSAPIAEALVKANRHGARVQVILDSSQAADKYSSADFLAHMGIRCYIDADHAIAHNKVMVIDGTTVITGSFNFTKAAEEKNAENLLVIQDAAMASKYTQNWQAHRIHSEPYTGLARVNNQSQAQKGHR